MREGKEGKLIFDRKLLINILIIIAIVSLGMLAINQTLGYLFKTQFLLTPCELCVKANPQYRSCMENTHRTVGSSWYNINISELSSNLSIDSG